MSLSAEFRSTVAWKEPSSGLAPRGDGCQPTRRRSVLLRLHGFDDSGCRTADLCERVPPQVLQRSLHGFGLGHARELELDQHVIRVTCALRDAVPAHTRLGPTDGIRIESLELPGVEVADLMFDLQNGHRFSLNGPSGRGHGVLKKQDSAPVWHAGPAAFTRSKTVSRSQSSRTSTTSIEFPDVSPFRHSPRSREWKHACPVSRECFHASSAMYA